MWQFYFQSMNGQKQNGWELSNKSFETKLLKSNRRKRWWIKHELQWLVKTAYLHTTTLKLISWLEPVPTILVAEHA